MRRRPLLLAGVAAVATGLSFGAARYRRTQAHAELVSRYEHVRLQLLVRRPQLGPEAAQRRTDELMRAARLAAEGRSTEAHRALELLESQLSPDRPSPTP